MSPNRVYWLSFVCFGLAAAASAGVDIVHGATDIATLVSALGGAVIVAVAVVTLSNPERVDGPTEWGPLVYLVAGSAALYVALTVWEFVSVVL
ncbi:hypothetical protein KU306_11485 [Haloferax larsenii]|uniref:Uncharacterized protein n=1 Tax=Haloferax larsenii TaxID=302484 RepID=A0ABY5RB42_HALLR|nr:hypothetical protein [Haloferax larsenii]UVE49536.1 hypothetical protein KU306_11485 [Haloferax larsenii]